MGFLAILIHEMRVQSQHDEYDHPSKDRLNDFTGVLQSKVKSLCLEDHRQENNLMTSN